MDSRLRGNDEVVGDGVVEFVIPVETGIHVFLSVESLFLAVKPA
jgi:hypothetical protein